MVGDTKTALETDAPEARAVGARAKGADGSLVNYEVCYPTQKSRRFNRFIRRHEAQQRAYRDFQRDFARLNDGGGAWDSDPVRLHRSFWCGRKLRGSPEVEVRYTAETESAHYSGVQYCGSVWRCPVCGAIIRNFRAGEVAEAVERWQREGNGLYMVTVTVRHHRGDDLAANLDVLSQAWRRVVSGRAWGKAKESFGVVGYIRSLEITYSDENGWHPHFHFLFMVEGGATQHGAEYLRSLIFERWARYVMEFGGKKPNWEHGVDVRPVDGDGKVAAFYVSKVAEDGNLSLELARADLKESDEVDSITPFQLLDVDSDKALALWSDYVAATKGKRSVFFSRGLRKRLGMAEEKTDEEVAEELQRVGALAAVVDGSLHDETVSEHPEKLSSFLACIERGEFAGAAELLGCEVDYTERVDRLTGEVVRLCPIYKRDSQGKT